MAHFSKKQLEDSLSEWLQNSLNEWEKQKKTSENILSYPDALWESLLAEERNLEVSNFRVEWIRKQLNNLNKNK